MSQFKQYGYFIEYMVQGKYIGSINIEQPDRKEVGYYGRVDAVAKNDIVFENKKRIKKGTHYYTRMYPLCGARNKSIY
jgi:hypothetical protein